MTELRDRLQAAWGDAHRTDKELGGGGMSRVYLAQETALGRRVVVKVIPSGMAGGVNVERFRPGIRLAASPRTPISCRCTPPARRAATNRSVAHAHVQSGT